MKQEKGNSEVKQSPSQLLSDRNDHDTNVDSEIGDDGLVVFAATPATMGDDVGKHDVPWYRQRMLYIAVAVILALVMASVFIGVNIGPNQSQISPEHILEEFYNATSGDDWVRNDDWLSNEVSWRKWYGLYGFGSFGDDDSFGMLLRNNSLKGSMPSSFSGLTTLLHLYISSNEINGTLPSELGLMSNLETFEVDSNQITGTLPSELGLMKNLKYLRVSSNQLSGSMPSELGLLSNLLYLEVNSNELTGTIPSELGLLKQVIQIDLRDNLFSGSMPYELCALQENVTIIPPDLYFECAYCQCYN